MELLRGGLQMEKVDVFVGRQPIFDRSGNIFGYELLYRNSQENKFPNVDPEKATIEILINTFLSIGVDRIAGKDHLFINLSEKLLKSNLLIGLNPKNIVIELLEDIVMTPIIIDHIRNLKKAGFKIALDDFTLRTDHEENEELFRYVDIIKVDILNTTNAEQEAILSLKQQYPRISLLAEKVETKQQRLEAEKLNYSLFQGYFFAQPDIIQEVTITSSYTLYTHIMNVLNRDTLEIEEIANLIMRDLSLAYKMLRYINSISFGIPNRISSVKQALVLLGIEEVKKWMHVIMLHELGEGDGKGEEQALIEYSLIRGKICQLIAEQKQLGNIDEYFFAGMFSMVDLIMKRDMADILSQLHLSDIVVNTLLGKETTITPVLDLVIAMENFDW